MYQSAMSYEQRLAAQLPAAMQLQLHILPAHQELIAPLPTGYVGPVMSAAETWLREHGYRTLGPWMISWATNGQPQLRRPVSGALKAIRDKNFQTIEVPEQLLIAVPFVGWPILPHNFTAAVAQTGLDIIGSPLLLALTSEPPTIAWIPVTPRSTRSLSTQTSSKLGLRLAAPRAGAPVPMVHALLSGGIVAARVLVVGTVGVTFLMGLVVLIILITNGVATLPPIGLIFLDTFTFIWAVGPYVLAVLLVIWVIAGLIALGSVGAWNRFWGQRPRPPELLLGSRGEGQVGAWLK